MDKNCVREVRAADTRALKEFIELERKLMQGYPLFASSIDRSVARYLTGKSAFTRDCQVGLFIASDGVNDIARCAAIINPKYQKDKGEAVGCIGYFAAGENCEPYVRAMLERAEAWLKQRGISRVIAPFNGNALLGMGFLVSAFDEEPCIYTAWNPPYYPQYILNAGYKPSYPLFVFDIDFTSEKYQSTVERARANRTIEVHPINKNQWHSDLEVFRTIINDNFKEEWEWYPITEEEFQEFFDIMKPIYDPGFMLAAYLDGKPVGVQIGIPNWTPVVRSLKGKDGPLEMLRYYIHGRGNIDGGLVFAAMQPTQRGMGITPILSATICERYRALGAKKVTAYTVNESNIKSRKAVESIGGVGRILYCAYDKDILPMLHAE
jgi:GNAT superfamily N-acetyltransferase